MNKRTRIPAIILLFLSFATAQAQQDTIRLHLRASVARDCIRLRWATDSPASWYFTNKHGVSIERYTLMKDGNVLDVPEKKILSSVPLKPPVLNVWHRTSLKDPYAAIIAQALYGKDFEVSGGRKGVGEIIALSQEQEQRYAMAMYAADLSFPAALFAGWGYEDKTAVKGEHYLYRIIPLGDEPGKHLETASAYLSLDQYEELPEPLELDALFGNGSVLLTWNYSLLLNHYNTYHIERSEDGWQFTRLNNTPLLNITGSDRIFYTDSIQNDKTYYYRVIGLTPFGDEGPPSDTISGKGTGRMVYIPHITGVIPYDNGEVDVKWDFDEAGNSEILAFELQRGGTDKGPFETIAGEIAPDRRSVRYEQPLPENYLRIAAIPHEGETVYSFPHLLQMADSVPPAVPSGLAGEIDSLGVVRLNWEANAEPDLLGYRVFRGQTEGEEWIPLNDVAVRTNQFTDTVSLQNLNTRVYYSVTALDRRYNQSGYSAPLTLEKPLRIPPAPPYLSRCEATEKGVELHWIPGRDETITAYSIWRREERGNEMVQIALIDEEALTSYTDSTVLENVDYLYQVCSINRSKLASDPSPAGRVKTKSNRATASLIKKFTAKRGNRGVELKWELTSRDIQSLAIYRKEPEGSFYLWKTPGVWDNETLDDQAMRNTAYEYMLTLKDRQGKMMYLETKIN